jgi:class 3 adenylate cyclase/tetratricopeptide (TPR) repeat protein
MQPIAEWLGSIGLAQYADRFAENYIDESVLHDLTDQHLKDLGVPLGHRLKMLRAIAELRSGAPAAAQPALEPEPKPRDDAERRQLTIMFVDLVGSTALSTRLDPEDLRSVIGAYHKRVADTITRFGGFVAKYMGDGVLIYFGYPQAHEDDPERAVRAGLALIEAVPALSAPEPIQVRIGIGTGLVVVGDLIGSGEAQERGVVGETPNLAARLQAMAAPGTIVIGPTTRRLLAGLFEYSDLGAIEVKGFSSPVQAYQVVRPSMVESRFEALRATTTPLVGRDEEIDLLMRRWEQAKRGDGQVVLICGEPGIGKSRIAQTVVERISAEPHTRLRYFCSPHHQDNALYPSIAQLERAAGFRRDDTPEQRLAKLEAVLAQGTNDLSEAGPLLADLLSIPTDNRYPPLNLTPQKRKEKTLQAMLAQIEGLAARQPVLMVWEDIHWSDPTTREALDLLVDRVSTLRVLVVLTYRPEFTPPWIGRPHVSLLTLNRLPPRQRAQMIGHMTGGKALPKEIADQIVDRTDGVPLFIEELTKTVVESGILREAGDHFAVAGHVAPLAIPTSLHASLLARLDRLAPTREIAQIGAALGRSFSHELISAVAQMPQQKLDEALEQLVKAELIFRRGTPPEAEYTFKHALVQDAAYSTLLRGPRQALHRRTAEALEQRFPDLVETRPEIVAHHYGEAGMVEPAIDAYRVAGGRAVAVSALEEAVAMFRRALALLADLPPSPDRDALELDIQIALGSPLVALEGYGSNSAHQLYERALSLCRKLHRPVAPPILRGLGLARLQGCRFDDCDELARALLDDESHDAIAGTEGRYLLGVSAFWRGDLARARHYLGGAIEAYDVSHRNEHLALYAQDSKAVCLVRLALVELWAGDAGRADQTARSALKIAVDLDHVMTLGYVITYVAILAAESEDLVRLAELLGDADLLWKRFSDRYLMVVLEALRGWRDVCAGSAGGIEKIVRSVARSRAEGETLHLTYTLLLLARARGVVGEFREGQAATREGLSWSHRCNQRYLEAELWRVDGELAYRSGETEAAAASLRSAVETARAQGAGWLELRALHSFASRLPDQTLREQLGVLIETIPSGHDLPAFRAATGLLSGSG